MGKGADGAKAGILGGLVYAVVTAIFSYIALVTFKTQVMNVLQNEINSNSALSSTGVTAQQLYNLTLSFEVVIVVIVGIIVGLILGLIFAYVYGKLPGTKGAMKGLSFGVILFVISILITLSRSSTYGASYLEINAAGALIGALAAGYVMGMLFERFEESNKPLGEEPPYPQM